MSRSIVGLTVAIGKVNQTQGVIQFGICYPWIAYVAVVWYFLHTGNGLVGSFVDGLDTWGDLSDPVEASLQGLEAAAWFSVVVGPWGLLC